MHILDSSACGDNDVLPDFLRCDVCIIGTGPAGITVARELSGTPLRVTILESGGLERREEADALNGIESIGWPRVTDQWLVRNRVVGGSSHTWTGRCAPFDEIDLQFRDWIPYSGWPFGIDDLVPYLDRSAKYLGLDIGSGLTVDRIWALTGHRQPRVEPDPDKLLPMFWQYSRDPVDNDQIRFGRRLDSYLGQNVTLVTNATVLRINVSQSRTEIKSVEFAATSGRRWSLPASTVVLCAGGIENARLLLASNNVMQQGLGNDRGLVGRFLMDHPRGPVASIPMEKAKAALSQFRILRSRGPNANLFHHGMRLSPTIQRSEKLLNCAIWIRDLRRPNDPQDSLTHFLRGESNARQGTNAMLANAGLRAYDLKEHLSSRRGLPAKLLAVTLDAMCEQRPNPDSRLTLSERRDRFGMQIPRIDWRVSEDEARSMRRITELMVEQFSRAGLEPPALADWVRDGGLFPQTIRDAAHPTGTTRMAADPACGVVDAQCQVHGIHGLFVGGSSVFPTNSHANPTHMIVALAVRLADTLKDRVPSVAEIRKMPIA